jgi:transcriptional regulator with XRE-family HTH domain
MSLIGKNIRKVRSIKGLSQSAFANLFDLTRASISAYEEGRAEPKMEVTMRLAKYLNIPIETLLTREITVNEFAKFNLQEFISGVEEAKVRSIPIVSKKNWDQFLKEGEAADLPVMSFPSTFIQGDIAF